MRQQFDPARTAFGISEDAAGRPWTELTRDDKTDFIGGWLMENETHDELVERALESAHVGDEVESWLAETDQAQDGRRWGQLTYDEKADAVEAELAEWDDEELAEKIVDGMDDDAIDMFRGAYEEFAR